MYFEDLKAGYKFRGTSITVTEAHIVLYGSLCGDFHPFHMNKEFAEKNAPGNQRVAHGMLTASLVVPSVAAIGEPEAAATHLGETFTFRHPVFIGDTITTECEITEATPKKNWGLVKVRYLTKNQRDEVVLEGEGTLGIKFKPHS